MAKDRRYKRVKYLIEDGYIKSFPDIFVDGIPKSVVAHDLGINNVRFSKVLNKVELFSFNDIFRLAELIEIEEEMLSILVCRQHKNERKQ